MLSIHAFKLRIATSCITWLFHSTLPPLYPFHPSSYVSHNQSILKCFRPLYYSSFPPHPYSASLIYFEFIHPSHSAYTSRVHFISLISSLLVHTNTFCPVSYISCASMLNLLYVFSRSMKGK